MGGWWRGRKEQAIQLLEGSHDSDPVDELRNLVSPAFLLQAADLAETEMGQAGGRWGVTVTRDH